jgi:hypothetical protein
MLLAQTTSTLGRFTFSLFFGCCLVPLIAGTELVQQYRHFYFATVDPLKRRMVLQEIVQCIANLPGRFVKHDDATGTWRTISQPDAIKKTARAIQYRDRQSRHERHGGGDDIAPFMFLHVGDGGGRASHHDWSHTVPPRHGGPIAWREQHRANDPYHCHNSDLGFHRGTKVCAWQKAIGWTIFAGALTVENAGSHILALCLCI